MTRLKLLARDAYVKPEKSDPLVYYYLPVIGNMYRRRVELALNECTGGENVLEVGFGSGLSFLDLKDKYQSIYGIDLDADPEAVAVMWNRHGIKPVLRSGNILELPYQDNFFDTVLLISILEHIHLKEQPVAMKEILRVLKPGGQMVYGVPIERTIMVFLYRLLGVNIREHHFSTQKDVASNARALFNETNLITMDSIIGPVYQVGNFMKSSN
jgi:ubiquinone/menaquinone biosynthesis C-methylase UbiE